MSPIFFLALLTATVLTLLCVSTEAATGPESVTELIRKGDVYSAKLQEAEALKCYLPAEKLEPSNVELLLSISRQYRHMMHDVSSDAEKREMAQHALQYAQRAESLAPHNAETHLGVAISYGKVLMYMGQSEKAGTSRHLREAVDKAIHLDPSNDLAWHVLGRWHKTIAGLNSFMRTIAQLAYGAQLDATNESAVKCFQKAIEINPHRLMHYIELGQTYAQMGHKEEARHYLEKGLAMPDEDKDDPELKAKGRATLVSLN